MLLASDLGLLAAAAYVALLPPSAAAVPARDPVPAA